MFNNLEIVRKYWKDVWNLKQLSGIQEFYAADCLQFKSFGHEGFSKNVRLIRNDFPDLTVRIIDDFECGDSIVKSVR